MGDGTVDKWLTKEEDVVVVVDWDSVLAAVFSTRHTMAGQLAEIKGKDCRVRGW
jgi:hypothetical protein